MNINELLVSIITPSFNQGRFIEDNILSVKNQEYKKIEHIIIDGSSTDNTLDVIKMHEHTYNLRWLSEPDEGQADAINKGFFMAKGDIIGWINSDDAYFDISAISTVVEFFTQNPAVNVLYGNCAGIDANNFIRYVVFVPEFSLKRLKKECFLLQPAVFFRRMVIDNDKLDAHLQFSMDYEYWFRLAEIYTFSHIDRILAVDREHGGRKTTASRRQMIQEARQVSSEFFRPTVKDRLITVAGYPLRALHSVTTLHNLDSRYTFAFDMKLHSMLEYSIQLLSRSFSIALLYAKDTKA